MDIMLVPVYGDAGGDDSSVKISPARRAEPGRAHGDVQARHSREEDRGGRGDRFDERSVAVVQARVNGYIERLFVPRRSTREQGQPLAEILAPDWVARRRNTLALKRSPQATRHCGKRRASAWGCMGMPAETIAAIEGRLARRGRAVTLGRSDCRRHSARSSGAARGHVGHAGARCCFASNGSPQSWVERRGFRKLRPLGQAEPTKWRPFSAYPGEKNSPGRVFRAASRGESGTAHG